jgi:preprotein translocase subunit YajC
VILSLILAASPLNSVVGFLPMVAIFGIFYFLLFLPMQRQKKQTAQMLQNLKKGDIVVTSGGLVGMIVDVNAEDDTIVIKVKPDNVKLQMARSAVASLQNPADAPK